MQRNWTARATRGLLLTTCIGALLMPASAAQAESLFSALSNAYAANPSLNAQRAATRAADEGVPQARAGYLPKLNATADAGYLYTSVNGPTSAAGKARYFPRGIGATVSQTLFDGFRTGNAVSQAESQILASRESLRNTEQIVLLNGATAYMNVLRDTAILNLKRNNVEVLEEQLRQTRDRFQVGEVTRTDVAQAEASLAGSRSDASLAESNLKTSIASYRQVIGVEPKRLEAASPIENKLPKGLAAALQSGLSQHPQIIAALHFVDAQMFLVKQAEGALAPSLTVQGGVSQRWDNNIPNVTGFNASVVGTLSVPIWQGGAEYAAVRQAKELLGQRRIDVDTARDAVRQAVVAAWGSMEAAKAQLISGREQVRAAEVALSGVREEAKVGQRTTLDVLNAQQTLLNARVNLISSQRDRVVASYTVLAAIGRLDVASLGLRVSRYDAKVHFEQVKDKWFGLRTPDGR